MSDGQKAYASAKDCRCCGEVTDCSFNIAFKRVRICENCAKSIAWQQIDWMFQQLQKGVPRNE